MERSQRSQRSQQVLTANWTCVPVQKAEPKRFRVSWGQLSCWATLFVHRWRATSKKQVERSCKRAPRPQASGPRILQDTTGIPWILSCRPRFHLSRCILLVDMDTTYAVRKWKRVLCRTMHGAISRLHGFTRLAVWRQPAVLADCKGVGMRMSMCRLACWRNTCQSQRDDASCPPGFRWEVTCQLLHAWKCVF